MNSHIAPKSACDRVGIWREMDAERINAVLNDPKVRPDVADAADGPLDLSAGLADHRNVLLMGEHGGIFAIAHLPGTYEPHSAVLKSGRGDWVTAFGREFTHWMFTRTDAVELVTRVPREHLGGQSFAQRSGFLLEFSKEDGCAWRGKTQPVDVYTLTIQEWIKHDPFVEDIGAEFHEKMTEKALALGVTEPPHGEMPDHNRYLGAAVAMIRNGQLRKGIGWYNRHALVSRHRLALLSGDTPPTIKFDLGTMIFQPDGDFEVRLHAGP